MKRLFLGNGDDGDYYYLFHIQDYHHNHNSYQNKCKPLGRICWRFYPWIYTSAVLEVYDKCHVIMMIVIANMNDQGGDEPPNLENKGGVVI